MSRKRLAVLVSLSLLVLTLAAGPATAQSGFGSVLGRVIDENAKAVVGADVEIKGIDTGRDCTVKTDKHGEYFCANLLPGSYEITVKYKGFVGKQQRKVSAGIYGNPGSPDFRNKFDFQLGGEAKGQAEAIKKQQEEFEKAKAGYERAQLLNKEGKYEEALAELKPVVEKDPSQWVVHWQLAVSYLGLNRLEEAEAAYLKAIELNPTEAALYNNLGQLYLKMKRVEDARKQFEMAAELNPEGAAASWFNLGVTFYNSGDLRSAIEPLRKATELDPNKADAFYWLGVCLYSTAETKIEGGEVKTILVPGTRESFERYLALEPSGRYANDAKTMLQAIDATVPTSVRMRKKKS